MSESTAKMSESFYTSKTGKQKSRNRAREKLEKNDAELRQQENQKMVASLQG